MATIKGIEENIRKSLFEYFKRRKDDGDTDETWYGISYDDILAWLEKQGNLMKALQISNARIGELIEKNYYLKEQLEKQGEQKHVTDFSDIRTWKYIVDAVWTEKDGIGQYLDSPFTEEVAKKLQKRFGKIEQKPANNVEPKFHVGDWVVFNDKHESIYQVEKIEGGYYILRHTYGGTFRVCVLHDEDLRLWTINDAKDGDVLAWDYSKCIALFKNIYDKESFNSYGFVGGCTGIFGLGPSYHDIEGAHPATKEQRDLLFQKMKESGYEWVAGKKELKKLSFRAS